MESTKENLRNGDLLLIDNNYYIHFFLNDYTENKHLYINIMTENTHNIKFNLIFDYINNLIGNFESYLGIAKNGNLRKESYENWMSFYEDNMFNIKNYINKMIASKEKELLGGDIDEEGDGRKSKKL